jgi:hypothetical protein
LDQAVENPIGELVQHGLRDIAVLLDATPSLGEDRCYVRVGLLGDTPPQIERLGFDCRFRFLEAPCRGRPGFVHEVASLLPAFFE